MEGGEQIRESQNRIFRGSGSRDYEEVYDQETGELIGYIDPTNGEFIKNITVDMPSGSFHITPLQLQIYKARKECEAEQQVRHRFNDLLGPYFFIRADEQFEGIAPEHVIRLIYLATYLPISKEMLMRTERTPIRQDDLMKLLGVAKSTITRFLETVSPRYLTVDESGLLYLDRQTFRRGKLTSMAKKEYTPYRKLLINGVQALYHDNSALLRKRLGCFFKLLPYINAEYNLICQPWCVEEQRLDLVEPLSVTEFCELCHFDRKHWKKYIKEYSSISFMLAGQEERFWSLIPADGNPSRERIFINPYILYQGSDYQTVIRAGGFDPIVRAISWPAKS